MLESEATSKTGDRTGQAWAEAEVAGAQGVSGAERRGWRGRQGPLMEGPFPSRELGTRL